MQQQQSDMQKPANKCQGNEEGMLCFHCDTHGMIMTQVCVEDGLVQKVD